VLRFALIALAAVITLLFIISLLPKQSRAVPDSNIDLRNATVTLYPQEDPEAVWFFSSPEVSYNPDIREATLKNIEDGKRTVDNKTDFSLVADEVTISNDDNLRGDHIVTTLTEDELVLDMQAKDGRQVLINQREGQFQIPEVSYYEISSPENNSILQDMLISFDLNTFTAGGEGTVGITKFQIEDSREED